MAAQLLQCLASILEIWKGRLSAWRWVVCLLLWVGTHGVAIRLPQKWADGRYTAVFLVEDRGEGSHVESLFF